MGWWIALAVLVLLIVFPLGIRMRYDAEKLRLWVLIGPVSWKIYPAGKKKAEQKITASDAPETAENAEVKSDEHIFEKETSPEVKSIPKETANTVAKQAEEKIEKGGSLRDFLPLMQLALDFLGDLRRKIRVDKLYTYIVLAGDDPCDLAVNYGRANAALGALIPHLERLFVIKKRDVKIDCDFETEHSFITADLQVTITFGRILMLFAIYGFRALREFMKIKKLRKGGINHEPDIT